MMTMIGICIYFQACGWSAKSRGPKVSGGDKWYTWWSKIVGPVHIFACIF